MEGEAGAVDARAFVEVGVHADLDQIRGGDLGIQQFVALDQKVARIGRASHRRMVEDHISPAVMSEQAIYCGKIHARLPVDIGGGSVVGGLNVHGEVSLAAVYAKRRLHEGGALVDWPECPTGRTGRTVFDQSFLRSSAFWRLITSACAPSLPSC